MFDDQKRRRLDALVWASTLIFLFVALPKAASAATPTARPGEAAWREECGSCHVAYPAGLLPAASWRELLAGLERHFGVDASLDATTTAEISRFLASGAGQAAAAAAGQPTLRLTETPWFRREHREVTAATWQSEAVRSPANCHACHRGAVQGRFEEGEGERQ